MSFFRRAREAVRAEDLPLLAAVLLLPWLFGGVEIWVARSASLLLALAAAAALAREGFAGLGLDRDRAWLAPAALLGILAAFQLLPLPPPLLRAVSPRTDEILRANFPGYPGEAPPDLIAAVESRALDRVPEARGFEAPEAPGALPRPEAAGRWDGRRPLSLHPNATAERLFWYGALLLAFLVVRARARESEAFRLHRGALFCLFVALALFGIAQRISWNGRMFWIGPAVESARPFGPYVNCVHFAGVMELAAPWLLGWAWSRTRRLGRGAWRDPATLLAWAGAAGTAAAGIASESKAGAALIAAGVSIVVVFGMVRRGRRFAAAAAALAVWIAAGALLVQTGLGGRARSFLAESRGGIGGFSRIEAWRSAVPMVADFPVAGVGMGAFRDVFPRYLRPGETGYWDRLHNDYLEVVIEGGIPAGILVVLLAAGFSVRAVRGWRRARRGERTARLGLLVGLGALGLHAVVDFNHQIPANALLFVVTAALATRGGEAGEREPS